MKPLKDRPELTELLRKAAQHKMTPEEIEAQRQSWVRGEMALKEMGFD